MEKISALVIDDEPMAREGVNRLLATDPAIEVLPSDAFGAEAIPVIKALRPVLLFLDVQMPGKTGFQLIEALKPDELPLVVFVTAYDQYALKAFEVNAVDYLLKPFSNERFFTVLNKVKQVVQEKKSVRVQQPLTPLFAEWSPPTGMLPRQYLKKLIVKKGSHTVFVDVTAIDSIEANDYYVIIYEGRHQHLIRASLNSLEEQLDPSQFLRVHRSVILNIDRIQSLESDFNHAFRIKTRNGKSYKISRYRKEDVLKKLGIAQ